MVARYEKEVVLVFLSHEYLKSGLRRPGRLRCLARVLGYEEERIRDWMTGANSPNVYELQTIAQVLRLDPVLLCLLWVRDRGPEQARTLLDEAIEQLSASPGRQPRALRQGGGARAFDVGDPHDTVPKRGPGPALSAIKKRSLAAAMGVDSSGRPDK